MSWPWDRRDDESFKHWTFFCHYKDMGARRSLKKVAKFLCKSEQNTRKLSARYSWVDRAEAWDRYCEEEITTVSLEELKHQRQEDLRVLSEMERVGLKALIESDEVNAATARGLIETAIKTRLLLTGEATERIETTGKELDMSALDAEESELLVKLLSKIGAWDE